MARMDKRAVPIFNGSENFATWARQMESRIMSKGGLDALEADICKEPTPMDLSEADKRKLTREKQMIEGIARTELVMHLAPEIKDLRNDMSAFALWTELHALYSVVDTTCIVTEFRTLIQKMGPNEVNGRDFVGQFKTHLAKMPDQLATKNQLYALLLLSSLNERYASVATTFGAKKPSEFTLADVQDAISKCSDMLMSCKADLDNAPASSATKQNARHC
ncbi:hypothetical protein IWW39_000288 [Coemansia spiralis]|uniref:DUF4219 domain-containing protein n=1 Tax=Coemansia spiralis TaxID=417178 RepID=A0A9W8GL57_9FUNG|nr:hypothetical protein IWW39_000288 [Coemansia spiralis]